MSPHWNWLPFIALELYHFQMFMRLAPPPLRKIHRQPLTAKFPQPSSPLKPPPASPRPGAELGCVFCQRLRIGVFVRDGLVDSTGCVFLAQKESAEGACNPLHQSPAAFGGLHALINPCPAPEEHA